jgi:hypothetical protein
LSNYGNDNIDDLIPSYSNGGGYGTTTGSKDSVLIPQEISNDLIVNPIQNPELEIFECIKCNHPNVLKKKQRRRRQTRVRHFRLDDMVYSSFKRYCDINCVDRNYGLMLLLMNAKTQNIDYIINPTATVLPKNKGGRKPKSKQ